MKFVIKLGGATLENPDLLKHCIKAIAELSQNGHQLAVVHGGGVQISKLLAQLDKKGLA